MSECLQAYVGLG